MIKEPPVLTIVKNRPRPSEAQIAAFQGVPTGFICDAMEGQGALDTTIAPVAGIIDTSMHVAGPALVAENGPADILATMAAVTLCQPGDVVVASVGGWQGCSASGDQVMGMLKNAEAAGYVSNGPVRDFEGIAEVGLPVWCTGLNPSSPYCSGPGTVGGSANAGGRNVSTGDLIVADCNGVVVIPFNQIDTVINTLEEIKSLEEELEAKVKNGFRSPLDLEEMLASGKAVEID